MATLTTPQPARHPDPVVRASRLAYLMFERPDPDRAEAFLTDFGLRVAQRDPSGIYFRGATAAPFCYVVRQGAPRFVGFALEVQTRADLDKLAAVAGASRVETMSTPGGGECVVLTDPAGIRVEAVFGQKPYAALPARTPLAVNSPGDLHRINAGQRPPALPPEIMKLGHVVIEAANFQETCAWYTRTFGFIPSDVQVLPDGSPAVTFMRLDLGSTPADHHTLALVQGFTSAYSHSAYEVVDTDAVGMGQRVLQEKGWTHAWGIGRHILGSQIFDYWEDPWGDKHEHYSDGDLFTAEIATGIHPACREGMAQWGQAMPSSFTKPKLSPSNLAALIRNLRRTPDLTVRKLVTMARLFT